MKQEMVSGTLKQENGKAKVKLLLENSTEYAQEGMLVFSDVTVDKTTYSIVLHALFPNQTIYLLPGKFVRSRLDEGLRSDTLLVLRQGVMLNSRGDATALAVGMDDNVKLRMLKKRIKRLATSGWLSMA